MSDLTEQWKKGELPEGEYYCRTTHNSSVCKYYLSDIDNENMIEILAPVPSYEEWIASEKYNKHLEEVIKVYERKDKQATETSMAYNELLDENAILKELLKECLEALGMVQGETIYFPRTVDECIDKINEVLK